ncbi:MAG: O-acetyl-ADP-ribose deacetylase [Bacteroidales bacterium]|nr:O-acetyl-ADP-ribose deacetylase [Bacteroidales bacterium]
MIELVQGDITKQNVDAIVNAANKSLLGGGGVDGAIHRAAGPDLLEECRGLNGCNTGDAKITNGFKLQAAYVIHTVGPVWKGGKDNEDDSLRSCYIRSMELAYEYGLKSVAFPNISTGVYHFPKERAAKIAVEAVNDFMIAHDLPKKVIFVCFDDDNFRIYKDLLKD